jgi:hypothetical protein
MTSLTCIKEETFINPFYSHVIKFLSATLNRAIIEDKKGKSLNTLYSSLHHLSYCCILHLIMSCASC